jgi:hypothetical protein
MRRRFVWSAILALSFFLGHAEAQTVQSPVQQELDMAQQQLTQLHTVYDKLERAAALNNQNMQIQVKHWQDYYNSCKPADKWLCDQ